MSELIKIIASPVRRAIIARLWDGELTAGDIAAGFDLTAATVSSHLKQLREAGVVAVRTDGNLRWYAVNKEALHGLQSALFERGFDEGWLPPGEVAAAPVSDALPARINEAFETCLSGHVTGPPGNAFRYLVEPDRMERWCGKHITSDPVEGGKFAFS
ncbi:MAG: ArsR/SmtB family transcription factor, partial [Hyphomicrobiaceae bacterium]